MTDNRIIRKGIWTLIVVLWTYAGNCQVNAQEANGTQGKQDSLNVNLLFRQLPEVMVKGERPVARLERGRLTYNMPLLLQRMPADNAFEALGNLPGVSVQNEAVSFVGQPATLILNGKATTMSYGQAVERLKAMPADRLARAEVMLSAPARYHVRGAVINVVTKEYADRQISGQMQGGHTQDRYATGNLQGNLLYANRKLSLDVAYAYTNGHRYGEAEHKALHPLEDGRMAYADRTTNKTRGLTHYYRADLSYTFAESHSLGLAYTGHWKSYHSDNHTTGNSTSHQASNGHNHLHSIDLNYSLPVGLSLTASFTRYEAPKKQSLEGRLNNEAHNLLAVSNQQITKWSVAADQQHNLSKGWGLSYGIRFQTTGNNSFQTTETSEREILPEATNRVNFDERITNAYVGVSRQTGGKVSLDGTIAVENYHTPQWNEWRVYPSINAIWNANDRNMLNLSFSSDARYPSYWSTMSSIHYSSTYSEIWGNPDLKPTRNYNLALMWQLNRRHTFVAFADLRPDFSVQLPYQPSDRMAVIMKEVNFNHRNTYGLQASTQFRAGSWVNGNPLSAAFTPTTNATASSTCRSTARD